MTIARAPSEDLKVTVDGTWLANASAVSMKNSKSAASGPDACLDFERMVQPGSTPASLIPFYLAHRRLMELERKMIIDVEGVRGLNDEHSSP